jgi:hypothetical protein
MCKHKLEQTPFCACQKPQSKPTFIFTAAAHKQRSKTNIFGLWMCKHKLEHIPFCTCQNPNPKTLLSSKLLPRNKEATLQHLLRMWATIGDQKLCGLHGELL